MDTGTIPVAPSSAHVVLESNADNVVEILRKLGLPEVRRPVIIVCGGAGELPSAVKPRLRQLFSRGIARAAAQLHAVILDGGTQAGVMEIVGTAVADLGRRTPLVGVAPAALVQAEGRPDGTRVPLDPNHSHLILTLGNEWGDELPMMLATAES